LRIIVGSLAIGSNIFMSITNLLAEKEDENNLQFINETVRETRQYHKKTERKPRRIKEEKGASRVKIYLRHPICKIRLLTSSRGT
jgi:hypothetical protein